VTEEAAGRPASPPRPAILAASRDNFALNVPMLVRPSEDVRAWQQGR
jgi:hypothetical protein